MGHMAYVVDQRNRLPRENASRRSSPKFHPAGARGAHRAFFTTRSTYVLGGARPRRDPPIAPTRSSKATPLAIPTFAWHQYFNSGDEPLRLLVHSTRPLMENLGFSLTHQGEVSDY